MRLASDSAARPPGTRGGSGALGRGADVRAAGRIAGAGLGSYASRLILSRCRGEILSDVIFPPYPPHPSVIDGSSPVVKPIDPSVVGVFTTMRNAGFFNPNCRMTSSFLE